MTIIDPVRAKAQAALREDAALADAMGLPPAPPRATLAPMLGEIFFKIIRGAVAAANGNHREASRFLKAAARELTLAIARAEQIAETERLPGKR